MNRVTLTAFAATFGVAVQAMAVTVSTVSELVSALNEHTGSGDVIQLNPGDYDLTGVEMRSGSHLQLTNAKMKGLGATCDEVRLIGDGTKRILYTGTAAQTSVENLTIQNGKTTGNGGGLNGWTLLTDCKIVGCKADGNGGGVSDYTICTRCEFLNNEAANGGAAHNFNSLDQCVVRGNHATKNGGGAHGGNASVAGNYYGSVTETVFSDNTAGGCGGGICMLNTLTGCTVADNTASADGGGVYYVKSCVDVTVCSNTASANGGGLYHVDNVRHCVICDNQSVGSGGGVYQSFQYGTVADSQIVRNAAESSAGGGCQIAVLTNCFVSQNVAKGYGGGLFKVASCVDSVICSNKVDSSDLGYGGGICSVSQWNDVIERCKIFGNQAVYGGGLAQYDVKGVKHSDIHDNYASKYGGGLYNSKAFDCVLSRNYSVSISGFLEGHRGGNAYASWCDGCEIVGSSIANGCLMGCRIRDIGKTQKLEGNPYGTIEFAAGACLIGTTYATNCLVFNNAFSGYNKFLFSGLGSSATSRLVNCTIVSNKFGKTFCDYSAAGAKLKIENSVFFGNIAYYNPCDLAGSETAQVGAGSISFSHVAYGSSTDGIFTMFADMTKWTDDPSTLYQFGKNGISANPRFAGGQDPENPYALLRRSPLIGRAAYGDWMSFVTDIRGEGFARATDDHRADIGCYQCWIPAPGSLIMVR